MFYENKYTRIYYKIIDNAKNRPEGTYYEKHHIVPKSIGGNNKKNNLVKLSAREHFICHWLLTKMVIDELHRYKMVNAFTCMLYRQNDYQHRYRITSRIFENIKTELSKIKSRSISGNKNPMFGKKHTQETKDKMSKSKNGKIVTATTRQKISEALTGKKKSEAHISSMISAWDRTRLERSGNNHPMIIHGGHSEETKEKIRQIVLKMEKHNCPHCGLDFSLGNFRRWHGDKCKFLNK